MLIKKKVLILCKLNKREFFVYTTKIYIFILYLLFVNKQYQHLLVTLKLKTHLNHARDNRKWHVQSLSPKINEQQQATGKSTHLWKVIKWTGWKEFVHYTILTFKRIHGCCKILIVISCSSESTFWVEVMPTWIPRRVEAWIIRSRRVVVIHPRVTGWRCDQSHPIWNQKSAKMCYIQIYITIFI